MEFEEIVNQRLKRRNTVAIVASGRVKKPPGQLYRACDLYVGRLFKLAYRHARDNYEEVYFLSPKHGLLDTHEEIEPYDYNMLHLRGERRARWGVKVVNDLMALHPMTRLDIVFFAGPSYVEAVTTAVNQDAILWTTEDPLRGLDLWDRMAWFQNELGEPHEKTSANQDRQ